MTTPKCQKTIWERQNARRVYLDSKSPNYWEWFCAYRDGVKGLGAGSSAANALAESVYCPEWDTANCRLKPNVEVPALLTEPAPLPTRASLGLIPDPAESETGPMEALWRAARSRLGKASEERPPSRQQIVEWVADNALVPWGEIQAADVPSLAAVGLLQYVKTDDGSAKFWDGYSRTVFTKMLVASPPEGGFSPDQTAIPSVEFLESLTASTE